MVNIKDFDFAGKKAIVRVDFNVPLNEKGEITDDTRIRGALPTLKKILADGGALILMSHMGKPKAEFYIPTLVNDLVLRGEAQCKVLTTESKWFGVTYSADRPAVVEKFAQLHEQGIYPEKMF